MSAIAKFRTSSHCLFIELGRYTRPYTPAHQRLCKYCNLGNIDDEIHMLLDCKAHNQERKLLFAKIVDSESHYLLQYNNREELFKFILKQKCPDMINALGKYLYTGFKYRSERFNSVICISLIICISCIGFYILRF